MSRFRITLIIEADDQREADKTAEAIADVSEAMLVSTLSLDVPEGAIAELVEPRGQGADPKERAWRARPVLGYFTIGNTITPVYLRGLTIPVRKVNDTTYSVEFPNEPAFRTWAGRWGSRINKTAGTFTPSR